MVTALVMRGSDRSDLQVHGSPNTPKLAMKEITNVLGAVTFDLSSPDFIFDVQTGTIGYPDEEVLM